MKSKIIQVFIELIVIGGGGMFARIIEASWWIGVIIIAIGIIGLVITLFGHKIPVTVRVQRRQSTNKVTTKTEDILQEKDQKGDEEKWLRPVIEWIDFKREWLAANQIMLKYQIDSGLVYDFKPYRMWIKLRIGEYEPKDGWEVLQTPNLLKGKRSQFGSEVFRINDDDLLKVVERRRQGLQIAQTLKIIVQLRDGDNLRVLESSYSINPYSEFVQEIEGNEKQGNW